MLGTFQSVPGSAATLSSIVFQTPVLRFCVKYADASFSRMSAFS